jgi:alkylhydroperoxidase family enzyme
MTFQIYSQNDAPPASREALFRAQEGFGYVPPLLGIFAGSPALLNAYMSMDEWMKKASFSEMEREVVLKTVAHMSNCAWCASPDPDSQDEASNDISNAEQGQKLDDEKLEALRLYATSVMQHHGRPGEEAKQKFLAAGYGPQQALEIVLGVGLVTVAALTASLAHTALETQRH